MEEKEIESTDLERSCQGISPGYAACTYPLGSLGGSSPS